MAIDLRYLRDQPSELSGIEDLKISRINNRDELDEFTHTFTVATNSNPEIQSGLTRLLNMSATDRQMTGLIMPGHSMGKLLRQPRCSREQVWREFIWSQQYQKLATGRLPLPLSNTYSNKREKPAIT